MSEPDFGIYEIMDRAHIASTHFHGAVLEHPRIADFPELRRQAASVADAMEDFYQSCGQLWGTRHVR